MMRFDMIILNGKATKGGCPMKYGIAIFPNKEIQDYANSYRKRYDPHYILIPPHITLHDAFVINDDDLLQETINFISEAAKSTATFELHVNKAGTFHPVNKVIYLGVEEQPTLFELFNKLNTGLLQQKREYAFVPHITIGQKMNDDELHDVYNRLKMDLPNKTFKVDRFHLLYQMDNGAWTVYQTFLLEG